MEYFKNDHNRPCIHEKWYWNKGNFKNCKIEILKTKHDIEIKEKSESFNWWGDYNSR